MFTAGAAGVFAPHRLQHLISPLGSMVLLVSQHPSHRLPHQQVRLRDKLEECASENLNVILYL